MRSGTRACHGFQRVRESVQRLFRQAVDQVEVDRAETRRARRVDQGDRLVHALDAVDRALHGGIEVLHAEADAVETEPREPGHVVGIGMARIDLDAELALPGSAKRKRARRCPRGSRGWSSRGSWACRRRGGADARGRSRSNSSAWSAISRCRRAR
jgi:hypothetical protein